jgi:Tol biopolymer transport system component
MPEKRKNDFIQNNSSIAIRGIALVTLCSLAVVALLSVTNVLAPSDTIVFNRDDGHDTEILVVNTDGSNLRVLTDNAVDDWAPVWTPDKSEIVFHSTRDGLDAIYLMDADGSNVRRITPEGMRAQFPGISPDGKYVAYTGYNTELNWDIFVSPVAGGEPVRLTNHANVDGGASWSPDGTEIVFFRQERDGYDIYKVNVATRRATRLTFAPNIMDVFPTYSPDGSQIVFHSERDGNSEIYIMNADGSNPRNLTHSAAKDRVPRFSADGSQIAFRSERDGNSEIFIMNADGSDAHPITDTIARNLHPDW